MQDVQRPSRVPSHLRPFHNSPLPPQPTLFPTSPASGTLRGTSSPALCPPRWRSHHRQRRPTLRAALRTIICKDWSDRPAGASAASRSQELDDLRPAMKRLKDSDDYITARAANPRTGLISPSPGMRTPCTPDSPGEALKLHNVEHISPIPMRPLLTRANEGRKVSSGHEHGRGPAGKGRQVSGQQYPLSPEALHGEYAADGTSICSPTISKDDQFVVHMPSAREPQPFTYPGYSPEQIEAFQHYKDKSRRVSGDGYDQRLIPGSEQPSNVATAVRYKEPPAEQSYVCPFTGLHFRPYRHAHAEGCHEPLPLQVRNRDTKVDEGKCRVKSGACKVYHGRVSSAKSHLEKVQRSLEQTYGGDTSRTTIPGHRKYSKHAEIHCTVEQGAGSSAPSHVAVANARASTPARADQHEQDSGQEPSKSKVKLDHADRVSDLSKLPKVRLVRPEHAGLPTGREVRRDNTSQRQCSLGRQNINGDCVERRNISSTSTVLRKVSPFESMQPAEPSGASLPPHGNVEVLISILIMVSDFLCCIPMPKVAFFETLASSEVSVDEKVEALKAVLTLLGHALAVCTALAMIWKLGAALMQVLEVLLWPLAVPLRVLRWMAVGS